MEFYSGQQNYVKNSFTFFHSNIIKRKKMGNPDKW